MSAMGNQRIRAEIVAYMPALRSFAHTFHRNATDADDLVQETLLKALANLDKFQEGTNLKSWMFTIMRNTFCTRAKLAKREAPGREEVAVRSPDRRRRSRNGICAASNWSKPSAGFRPRAGRSSKWWR